LIVLFQRGAADGLNIVVPFAEPNYYAIRPTIAIPQPRAGRGGMRRSIWTDFSGCTRVSRHYCLSTRMDNWLSCTRRDRPIRRVRILTRRTIMESGTPGVKATEDGWLNRTLQTDPETGASPFRAVAMGANLPLTLRGSAPAIALPDVKQFKIVSQSPMVEGGFEALYAQTVDTALRMAPAPRRLKRWTCCARPTRRSSSRKTAQCIQMAKLVRPCSKLRSCIKAGIGLEVTFVDTGRLGQPRERGVVRRGNSRIYCGTWVNRWRHFRRTWATAWKMWWWSRCQSSDAPRTKMAIAAPTTGTRIACS
jgi:uncharacterized protein (DUF1501 family)